MWFFYDEYMEREKRTKFILKQFKKKTKRLLQRNNYTEFFFINKERKVIEFLTRDSQLTLELFFKEFLPREFREFVTIRIFNEVEEEIKTWYYKEEDIVLVFEINWGSKFQEISTHISIEPFIHMVLTQSNTIILREINYELFNEYVISILMYQAKNLSKIFETINFKKKD